MPKSVSQSCLNRFSRVWFPPLSFDPREGSGAVPNNANVNYLGMVKHMPVSEFLSMANRLNDPNQKSIDYQKEIIKSGKPLGNPFLHVDWNEDKKHWKVVGHEGRHRATAIHQLYGPNEMVPVHIFPKKGMRARHITDEMRNAPFVPEQHKNTGGEVDPFEANWNRIESTHWYPNIDEVTGNGEIITYHDDPLHEKIHGHKNPIFVEDHFHDENEETIGESIKRARKYVAKHNADVEKQRNYDKKNTGGEVDDFKPVAVNPESDQNRDKFMEGAHPDMFDEHGAPKRWYHGTPRSFKKFNRYESDTNPGMHFVTSDPVFASRHTVGEPGSNVMPLHVNVKNPFDYENPEHLKRLIDHVPERWMQMFSDDFKSGNWSIYEEPEVKKAIRDLGHDSMYVSERNIPSRPATKNLAIFNDPRTTGNHIKSAIGNNGNWDPKKPEITESNGGFIDRIGKAGGGGFNDGGGFDPDAGAFGRIGTDPQQQLQSRLAGPQIVKQPGGQWFSGNVEDALSPLKKETVSTYRGTRETPELAKEIAERGISNIEKHPENSRASRMMQLNDTLNTANRAKAVNDFVGKQLTRYVKNDMGTEGDPVRALAERGILHYVPNLGEDENQQQDIEYNADKHRKIYGGRGLADHPLAKKWENSSDSAIESLKKSEVYSQDLKENPWLNKLEPYDVVHHVFRGNFQRGLGFDHLVDELHNSVNPESGLPNHLQLNPESLSRMSVPQAVQHVHNINKWREDNRAEANKKLAFNPATFLHKDYPDSDYAWYQIRHPDMTDEEKSFLENNDIDENDYPQSLKDKGRALDEALKYEGDTMGHCVGGYSDEVANGESNIYSLRNKKTGEPHVTVEVNPSEQEHFGAPPDIAQIKGKGNKKPVDRYLPYVQDFVKSGNWDKVGDLQNTDLRRMDIQYAPYSDLIYRMKKAGENVPKYMTEEEFQAAQKRHYPQAATGGAIIAKAVGGSIDPQKAIRRALMAARGEFKKGGKIGQTQKYGKNKKQTFDALGQILAGVRSTNTGKLVKQYQDEENPEIATKKMYGDLLKLAKEGEPGRYWYEKSSKHILNHVAGDKNEADKLAQLIAIYSPQTTVHVNTNNAIKAYNRAKAGDTLWNGTIVDKSKTFKTIKESNDYLKELGGSDAGYSKIPLDDTGLKYLIAKHGNIKDYDNIATADRDLKAHLVMNMGIPFEGRKTNNFYNNLMVHIDPSRLQGSTQDLWMAKAFGFHDPAIAGGKYDFMERLTKKMADRLKWEPHQVQAAIWTAMKARQELISSEAKQEAVRLGLADMVAGDKGKKKFVVKDGMEQEYSNLVREQALSAQILPNHIADSSKDFSDFLNQNLANISWESTPSTKAGHLEGFEKLTPEQKADYHHEISKALQDENGNDLLAKHLGLLTPGYIPTMGYWEGASNPATQTLVGSTRIKGAGQLPNIDASSQKQMETYAAGLGLLLKQDGVGYHRPFYNPKAGEANGIEYEFDKPLTADHIKSLGKTLDATTPGAALIPNGPKTVRVLNFSGPENEVRHENGSTYFQGTHNDDGTEKEIPEGHQLVKTHPIGPSYKNQKDFHARATQAVQSALPSHHADSRIFASDGNLIGNDWVGSPNGENYVQRLRAAGRSDVLGHISSVLAPRVEAVDRAFASKHGLKRNKGIEKTLRSFQGPASPAGQVTPAAIAPAPTVAPALQAATAIAPSASAPPPTLASGGLVDHAMRMLSGLRNQ